MNGSYTVPFLLSLAVHSTLAVYAASWIEVPALNLRQAPSALEICVLGSDEIKQKTDLEKNKSDKKNKRVYEKNKPRKKREIIAQEKIVTDDVRQDLNVKEEKQEELNRKVECKILKKHETPRLPSANKTTRLGNSSLSHQSFIGAQYRMKDPSLVFNPSPHYPRKSRERGEEGMVILDIEILSSGSVGDVKIFSSSGYTLLDKAAQDAVLQWRFNPACFNNHAVSIRRKIPVVFKLR